jgi:hypothetical protein
MTQPSVTDFDDGEISVRLNGKELRGWSYRDDTERRAKMLCAREYVEGWCDGRDASTLPPAHQTPIENKGSGQS